MPQLTVIGYPLNFTLSPQIHSIWLNKYNLPYQYFQSPLNNDEFFHFFHSDSWKNYIGLNITIPYKGTVIQYLDYVSEEVRLIGACNTIYIKDGYKYGFNTDYIAIKNSLKDLKIESCLIVGAGGFAKAAYHAVHTTTPGCIIDFCNRSAKKLFDATYIGNIHDIQKYYDLVIIAIPRSDTYSHLIEVITARFPNTKIIDSTYSDIDIVYSKNIIASGKKLLVDQARYSFEIWFGIFPDDIDYSLI